MKKLFALLLGMGIVFGGCNLLSNTSENEETESSSSTEGSSLEDTLEVITTQGFIELSFDNREALYVLTAENGDILFDLESSTENLAAFIGKGRVEVEGKRKGGSTSSVSILIAEEITLLETVPAGSIFRDENLNIELLIPGTWVYEKSPNTETVVFYSSEDSDTPVLLLDEIEKTSVAGESFSAELTRGTEISVGGQQAWRFIRSAENIEVIVSREDDFLLLDFSGDTEQKAEFYTILLSISFSTTEAISQDSLQMCGGIAGLLCPTGYRCELEGEYPDASGYCKPAVNVPTEENPLPATPEKTPSNSVVPPTDPLPETPSPEEVSQDEENTPERNPELSGTSETSQRERVLLYAQDNFMRLIPEEDSFSWEIKRFIFSGDDLLAVEYADKNDTEVERKILFSYTVNGTNVVLEREAFFTAGEESDWVLEEGQNLQAGKTQDIFSAEGESQTSVAEGYRLYESTHYNFSVEYPKNGYYAHLGSINNTLSTVVFALEPATDANAVWRIEILDGTRSKRLESKTEIIVPRDEDTHFRLTATSDEYAEQLAHMADSISSL